MIDTQGALQLNNMYFSVVEELEINSKNFHYQEFNQLCTDICNTYLTSNKLFDFLLCVEEILANCIIHAYKNTEGKISISFSTTDNYLIVKIRDFGKGIDDTIINDIKCPSPSTINGRGLFIAKNLSDLLEINNNFDEGTQVSIYFKINALNV